MGKETETSSEEKVKYLMPIYDNKDNRSLRYRINVATSVKGVKTWDCTVDGEGYTLNEILDKSNELVKALEQKYPIEL